MPDTTCDRCGVAITDAATAVHRSGQTFCCPNCARVNDERLPPGDNFATCAHCKYPIIDRSTQVQRDGRTFCCANCAAALVGPA